MTTKKTKIEKYSKTIKNVTENDFANIANDITSQLETLSKFGKFYDDLVNEYLYLLSVRESLKEDIRDKGLRYDFVNGNGKEQEKPNESVTNLIKIEQIMLKIINDLGINQPFIKPPSENSSSKEKEVDEDDLL